MGGRRRFARGASAVLAGLLVTVVGGCNNTGAVVGTAGSNPPKHGPQLGSDIGDGLLKSGLVKCIGPITSPGDPPNSNPTGLSLYAEDGFAAIVGRGRGAEDHSIALALYRNHVSFAPPVAQIAGVENRWRRAVIAALPDTARAAGPCGLAGRLPVLAATEVVCFNQVLIPLGNKDAAATFAAALGMLVNYTYSVDEYRSVGAGKYLKVPGGTTENRPYCNGP